MKKYFKSIVTMEVLSEYAPVEFDQIADNLSDGGDAGAFVVQQETKELSSKEFVEALKSHGIDSVNFDLDADGKDISGYNDLTFEDEYEENEEEYD